MAKETSIYYDFHRSYEVSVWTLQDSFITVLKWSDIEHKETIQSPSMDINTDGTLNFSFEIPMSLYINGVWRDNPIWYNTTNGTLITNMRKIKVIFNKKKEDEEVFEFLITNIEMEHSGDVPMCKISCDNGLAFHELGKQGYKISLSSTTYEEEDLEYFKNDDSSTELDHTDIISNDKVLHNNINYWCEQMGLEEAATDADIRDPRKWYYRVSMDWSSYSNIPGMERESNKIYEEEYVASWTDEGQANNIEPYREKYRLVDSEFSNLYNLTQTVAQTFEVYCKYQYLYDDNYHIIGKLIIFYNNFFSEQEGVLQLSYPHQASRVTRTIDSADIVTKLYIDNVDDDSARGQLSIMNTEANKMRTDYLLNFDYLHEVATITDEQYAAVKQYENDIRRIQLALIPLQAKQAILAQEEVEVHAKQTVADNGRLLAQDRLDENTALIQALRNTDGIKDEVISYTSSAPDTVAVLSDSGEYYIRLKTKGILEGTLKVYSSFPINTGTEYKINITKDSVGSIEKATILNFNQTGRSVYCVYDYNPAVYYEQFRQAWTVRQNKDQNDFETYSARLEEIKTELENITAEIDSLTKEQIQCEKEFQLMMGPALREGHWTPDNYANYKDSYSKSIKLPVYPITLTWPIKTAEENYLYAIWDKELFQEEQHNYFILGIDMVKTYYPHIYLNDHEWENVLNELMQDHPVSIIYYDYAVSHADDSQQSELFDEHELHQDSNWHIITIGSGADIIFVIDRRTGVDQIRPAIIITEAETMSDDEINHMKATSYLAHVESVEDEEEETISLQINQLQKLTINNWYEEQYLDIDSSTGCVYQVAPRLVINSLDLKNNSSELALKYNNVALEDYKDYQVLIRDDIYTITLKPMTIFSASKDLHTNLIMQEILRCPIDIRYSISNASTAMYLDALQISKENAYPKVSYTVSPTILNKKMISHIYTLLNRIVNINDNELKLHDAFGYVSEISLDLDHPWEDSITIQNYNNKFEDIFSTITAQTESMQRREYSLNETMHIVTPAGTIGEELLQQSIDKAQVEYSFNNGSLKLSENTGLLGTSAKGAVVFRNDGIFTATTQDTKGNWIWNSAILPEGINANLIKAGQLDTDKIMIYSGNDVRFQWNSEGLYAYRSLLETPDEMDENDQNDVNSNQFVVYNSDGLSLIRKKWNFEKPIGSAAEDGIIYWQNLSEQNDIPHEGIKQVEVSWNGLIMRNYQNQPIFYANSATGDLTITGNFSAHGGRIGGWHVDNTKLESVGIDSSNYVALNAGDYCIWAGDTNEQLAPFSVRRNGDFKSTSGEIGGWKIYANEISGKYIRLVSGTDTPGIMTTDQAIADLESIDVDDNTYYLYSYSYTDATSNQSVSEQAYHSRITFPVNSNYENKTVSSFNNADDPFLQYVSVITGVEPKYTITKVINQWNAAGTQIESSTSIQYVAWTDEDDDDNDYDNKSAGEDPRIIRTDIGDENSGIVYDSDLENANTLNADWYISVKNVISSSARPTLVINSQSVDLSSTDDNSWVNYIYEDQLSQIILDTNKVSGNIRVQGSSYSPTFRVEATTGKLVVNNATLGKFTLSEDKLSNGLIFNTQLDTSSYVKVPITDGTKKITLDKLGRCFASLKVDSKKGRVVLTRLDGTTVNFNVATLKATAAKNVAAGQITKHTLDVSTDLPYLIKSDVKTGAGNTDLKTMTLDTLINSKKAYEHMGLSLKKDGNDYYLCIHGTTTGTQSNTYNTSRTNKIARISLNYNNSPGNVNCTCTSLYGMNEYTLAIPDGGAYKAGYDMAVSEVSGNASGSTTASYLKSNNSINYILTRHNHDISGTITSILSNSATFNINENYMQSSFRILNETIVYTDSIALSIENQDNNTVNLIYNNNPVMTFKHNQYDLGFDAVQLNAPVWSQNDSEHSVTITVSAQNKNDNTPRSQSATITLSDVNTDENSVQLIYNNNTLTYTHNKYNSGWYACYNALDVVNHTVNIDGIDYYQCPISDLPTIN